LGVGVQKREQEQEGSEEKPLKKTPLFNFSAEKQDRRASLLIHKLPRGVSGGS